MKKAIFKGYSDDVAEDDRIFEEGDVLTIVESSGDSLTVKSSDGAMQVVFLSEVDLVDETLKKVKSPDEDTLSGYTPSKTPLKMTEDEVLNKLEGIIEKLSKHYMDIGMLLIPIQEHKLYEHKRYNGRYLGTGATAFKKFIADELGGFISYDKALKCMAIYRNMEVAGVTTEDLVGIPYTKAIIIAEVITEQNKKELLMAAKNKNKDDLRDYVEQMKIPEEFREEEEHTEEIKDQIKKSITLPFTFNLQDHAHIVRALDAVGNLPSVGHNNNNALLYIINEFLLSYDETQVPLEEVLKHINRKYCTNITVQMANKTKEMLDA